MDPAFLTNFEWTELGKTITLLWVFLLLIVLFAANLILAHVFIPSLVSTGGLSQERARLLRPALYAFSFTSLAALAWVFFSLVRHRGILSQIYERLWI